MAKVIGFSRFYPATHLRAGQPTYFVEKILNGFGIDYQSQDYLHLLRKLNHDRLQLAEDLWGELVAIPKGELQTKFTTIRETDTWKQGDVFSPRVWSGAPYKSKRLKIYNEWELVGVKSFIVNDTGFCKLGDMLAPSIKYIAERDGLHKLDWEAWFKYPKKYYGQQLTFNDQLI